MTATTIPAIVSGRPATAKSKNPNSPPAARAASLAIRTLTGVPVSARSEPEWPLNASGISRSEGRRRSRIAITTVTGISAATEPLTVTSADSTAHSASSSTTTFDAPDPDAVSRRCPAHVVTPVASRPSLTTNSDATKTTVGSPKPEIASR